MLCPFFTLQRVIILHILPMYQKIHCTGVCALCEIFFLFLDIGGVQLALLVILVLCVCALICVPCCLFLCVDDDDIYDDITGKFSS